MLFVNKKRTRTDPMRQGERFYDFYDSSASEGYDEYRALLNSWVEMLPEKDRGDLIEKMRGGTNLQYQACVAELMTCAALTSRGYAIESHPTIEGTLKVPDFLVRNQAEAIATYTEVTSFGPAPDFVAQSKRDAGMYNSIDKTRLPAGWRIGLGIVAHGAQQPSLKDLRREIEAWVKETATDPNQEYVRVFEAGDWKFEITLYGGFEDSGTPKRAIASQIGDVRKVSAATEIRKALEKKASKYGDLKAPYIVAVADCKDELLGGEQNLTALDDALFGTMEILLKGDGAGKLVGEHVRNTDGFFGTRDRPKNQGVSAVVLLPRANVWDLRNKRRQAIVIHNPWAKHPVSKDVLPLPGGEFTSSNTVRPTEGTPLADILGVPAEQPPPIERRWLVGRRFLLFCILGPLVWAAVDLTLETFLLSRESPDDSWVWRWAILVAYVGWLVPALVTAFLDRMLQRRGIDGTARTQASAGFGFIVTAAFGLLWVALEPSEPSKFILITGLAGAISAAVCSHFNQYGIGRR